MAIQNEQLQLVQLAIKHIRQQRFSWFNVTCTGSKLRHVLICRLVLKDYHQCGLLTLFIVWTAAVLGILYQYTYHER